jgi:hypothetical protein
MLVEYMENENVGERTVEYVEIKLLPHICWRNCRKMQSEKR